MKNTCIFILTVVVGISLSISLCKAEEKIVMVFGVFDLLHPGHISFLTQAQKYGSKLIAVVTRDEMVLKLKKRCPLDCEEKRLSNVQKVPGVHKAVLGDKELGSYAVIKEHKPDVICLGYDQYGLANHLEHVMKIGTIPVIPRYTTQPFEPETYHTSLLRKNLNSQKAEL
jgi:FAD synthetase